MPVTFRRFILALYCKGHNTAKYLSYVIASKLQNVELNTMSLVWANIQHVSDERY